MADSVPARLPEDDECIVAELHRLPPCPESEVIAITLLSPLQLVGRFPAVFLAELLLVGNGFATAEKTTNLFYSCALVCQRTLRVAIQRECGLRAILAVEWPRNFSSNRIVGVWDDFCDHAAEAAKL